MGMSYHVTRPDAKCPAELKNKEDPLFPLSDTKIDFSKGSTNDALAYVIYVMRSSAKVCSLSIVSSEILERIFAERKSDRTCSQSLKFSQHAMCSDK